MNKMGKIKKMNFYFMKCQKVTDNSTGIKT